MDEELPTVANDASSRATWLALTTSTFPLCDLVVCNISETRVKAKIFELSTAALQETPPSSRSFEPGQIDEAVKSVTALPVRF